MDSRARPLNICLEHVVSPALIAELRERPDGLLATALLDPAWHTGLRERFAGIQGCWARGEETLGTFLFWGMRAGRTVALREEAGELVGDGVRVRLEARTPLRTRSSAGSLHQERSRRSGSLRSMPDSRASAASTKRPTCR
jgi:hypothetical protein